MEPQQQQHPHKKLEGAWPWPFSDDGAAWARFESQFPGNGTGTTHNTDARTWTSVLIGFPVCIAAVWAIPSALLWVLASGLALLNP